MPYKKAIVALAHTLIVIIYNLLADPADTFRDLGGDYFVRHDEDAVKRRGLRQLEAPGYSVTLQPAAKPLPAA